MCGFVGIIGVEHAAPLLYSALQAIQHRGQDAAGIGTLHQGRFLLQKDLGLVSQALPASRIAVSYTHLTLPTKRIV